MTAGLGLFLFILMIIISSWLKKDEPWSDDFFS